MFCESCSFPNMNQIVEGIIKKCDVCRRTKSVNFNVEGPITLYQPTKILDTVSIVLMGPLSMGKGVVQYILAMANTLSKYTRLYALKWTTTASKLHRTKTDYLGEVETPTTKLSLLWRIGKIWWKKLASTPSTQQHTTQSQIR